ncbi:hypothetical protein Nepgr_011548 [Nepenthes gracilis]|uniref:Protein DA1-like domain-containing protein n=1 Tax=Nepenthes gracilis TaxID=150966 RepID=A0AAD3SFP4_NEPGR|nr:hypothetical protein Nepgr_011548 [Nepenthes gracilis]
MMHAWRHLNGYPNLNLEVEEGICQVLAHSWLDYEVIANSGSSCETNSSSSLSTSLPRLSLVSSTSSDHPRKVSGYSLRGNLVNCSSIKSSRMDRWCMGMDWKRNQAAR